MSAGFTLSDFTTGYRKRRVFEQLSLPTLPPGSLVAVLGPNAVGKSTLLKAIAGLQPASGRMQLNDIDLASLSGAARMRHVAIYRKHSLRPPPWSLMKQCLAPAVPSDPTSAV